MQIDRLTLVSRDVQAQRHFYGELLGLPTRMDAEGALHVQVGRTELIFQYEPSVIPFYHLAFRVATNEPATAVTWARQRVSLLADGEEEVFHSGLWDATQFYFADADGNVLEMLTRESPSAAAFGPEQILYVTEVGLPFADVLEAVALFEKSLGLARKNGESAAFNPVGDADGLLILVPAGRNWYPTAQPALPLPVRVELRAEIAKPIDLVMGTYTIAARPL